MIAKFIVGKRIIKVNVLPGTIFHCKLYKGKGNYEMSYGTVLSCNDRLIFMLCNNMYFSFYDCSSDSLTYYNKWNSQNGLNIKGIAWYLDFEKYPNNFGLSPKLFVVTDIYFNNTRIYESNYILRKYRPSLSPNYIYEATEKCKCFKYCSGHIFSSRYLEDEAENVIMNKRYNNE